MLFKNKTNQPQITTQNMSLYFSGTINSCEIDYLNEYALQLAMLRKVDLSQLNDKQTKRFKERYAKKHKELAAQISEQNAMYLYNIPSHYSDKIKDKMIDQLNESKFKSWLKTICKRDIADDEAVKPNYSVINNAINYSSNPKDREDIRKKYLEFNHRLLFSAFYRATLLKISNFPRNGKHEIRDGTLKFGDNFKLHSEYFHLIDITLPHAYKTEVLGSGLEVIDNKYLTITLTPYDSIIKDCQMYQAELLKVKKIFKDSEIEQAYIAKLDDEVLVAKSHDQLMRKVIKVKEAVKDNHSQAA
jgi:hypothetical protein